MDNTTPLTHVVTADDMLANGLLLANYSDQQINRCGEKKNRQRFNTNFGASPAVLCTIYKDLQEVNNEFIQLEGSTANLKWFLRTILYLRRYPIEDDFETIFHLSSRYVRGPIWKMIEKIQALKMKKIIWPDDLSFGDIWVMTVDGTHVWIEEPAHEVYSQDSDYFSHKFNKAGINYEIGISLATRKVIWMNGPFKAGRNDLQIFVKEGLENRLQMLGQKAIGDGIYRGHENTISYPNYHDSYAVKKFKSRALKSHEDYNGMCKTFKILSGRFRHGVQKIASAFESVAVICEYKIEADEPLFDVLVEDVVLGGPDDEVEELMAALDL